MVSAEKKTKKAASTEKPHGKKALQFGQGNAGTFGPVYPSDVLDLTGWSLQVGVVYPSRLIDRWGRYGCILHRYVTENFALISCMLLALRS